MPKISLKQKNRKRVTSFINVNNIETNISGHNFNYAFTDIKPSFPSTLTINELIKNSNANNKPKLFPNAFIAYRMALMKEYRIKNLKLPPMSEVSKIAKNYWNMEPKNVKDFYESLVKNAKSFYKQNNIQIVLDRHMNYLENNQESDATYNAIVNENLQVQNSIRADNSTYNNEINNSISINTSYDSNSTLSDREYIRVLEQTIAYLLKN
jgi:hypothetical protein